MVPLGIVAMAAVVTEATPNTIVVPNPGFSFSEPSVAGMQVDTLEVFLDSTYPEALLNIKAILSNGEADRAESIYTIEGDPDGAFAVADGTVRLKGADRGTATVTVASGRDPSKRFSVPVRIPVNGISVNPTAISLSDTTPYFVLDAPRVMLATGKVDRNGYELSTSGPIMVTPLAGLPAVGFDLRYGVAMTDRTPGLASLTVRSKSDPSQVVEVPVSINYDPHFSRDGVTWATVGTVLNDMFTINDPNPPQVAELRLSPGHLLPNGHYAINYWMFAGPDLELRIALKLSA